MKIIIVSNNNVNRTALKNAFIASGYGPSTLLSAVDGPTALFTIGREAREIGCLIADQHLPGVPGNELIRRVKRYYPKIKTVLIGTEQEVIFIGHDVQADSVIHQTSGDCAPIVVAVSKLIDFHTPRVRI